MPVYKDGESGTWRAQFYYKDWTGERHKKNKRGFRTKKEAQQYEAEYIRAAKADMDMKLSSFVEIYLKDKEVELKKRTLRNKRYMIDSHVIPYLGEKKMNEVSAADIIAWQKEIKEKNEFSQSYLRMLQNQVTAIFIHASRIYGLSDNPCKRVKKMGRSDDRSLDFWTLEEYEQFIDTFDKASMHFIMFELLFWTGMREGDDDDKIRLNQRKPSKYQGLRRFGPEKNLQRINKFMKERPIFYKNLIQMKENFRFYLRCFYCITKVVILQFNSENRTELARNG